MGTSLVFLCKPPTHRVSGYYQPITLQDLQRTCPPHHRTSESAMPSVLARILLLYVIILVIIMIYLAYYPFSTTTHHTESDIEYIVQILEDESF
ncbi:hypothetical protein BDN67DRAFT_967561 [Paxillus ammoniavirescens]|nr:hypothetical protein BDN67DRAFT_967561 [Paxillus ammoniavirescens]